VVAMVNSPSDFMISSVDSGKLPVVAAGQIFDCENDGNIHIWTRTAFTANLKKINTTPVCQIEVTLLVSSY
jgi:hypothetical protein